MATQLVYQINELGHYLYPTEARESPEDHGVYLIPRGCVEAAPPTPGPNQWPAWDGAAWGFVADFRGTVGYRRDTGEPETVTELGKTLDDLGLSAAPVPDPRQGQVAGAARRQRQEAARFKTAQKLDRRGDTLGALKLLNNL